MQLGVTGMQVSSTRMLLIKELNAVCRSCSIVWVVKCVRFSWAKHVARLEETKNAFIILIQELDQQYDWWYSLCISGAESLCYSNRG
jgi:hypothetical protein